MLVGILVSCTSTNTKSSFEVSNESSSLDIFQTWTDIESPYNNPPDPAYPWSFFIISSDSTVSAYLNRGSFGCEGAWYEGIVTKVEGDTLKILISTKDETSWLTMVKGDNVEIYNEEWVLRYDSDANQLIVSSVVGPARWSRMSVSQTFRPTVDDSYRSLCREHGTYTYSIVYNGLLIPITIYSEHYINYGSGELEKIGIFYDDKYHIIEMRDYEFDNHDDFPSRERINGIDLNFDGYMDLEILHPGGGNRAWYYRYLYDPIEKEFIFHEELSQYMYFTICEEEQTLTGFASSGSLDTTTSYFHLIDGVLTKFKIREVNWAYSDFFLIINYSTLSDDDTWFKESVLFDFKDGRDGSQLSRTEGHVEYGRYLHASPENYVYLRGLLERAHIISPEGERVLEILKNEAVNLNAWEMKLFESFREYIE
jgi:hypothetical protein